MKIFSYISYYFYSLLSLYIILLIVYYAKGDYVNL